MPLFATVYDDSFSKRIVSRICRVPSPRDPPSSRLKRSFRCGKSPFFKNPKIRKRAPPLDTQGARFLLEKIVAYPSIFKAKVAERLKYTPAEVVTPEDDSMCA